MATITPIQLLNRIGTPGAPLFLSGGELAYNQPDSPPPVEADDVLYVGNGTGINVLVGNTRQLELWGDQTILAGSKKTIDVTDLKLTGGQPNWLLVTDGNGNLSFTNAPGGGLTEVATDGVTLAGVGTVASPLSVVPHTVAVATDGVTLSGDGTTAHPLAALPDVTPVAVDGVTISGTGVTGNPIAVIHGSIQIQTVGAALNGNGTTANPLNVLPNTVPVATDGITITGNGTTGSPLTAMNGTVAVAVDGTTIAGEGVTASPLHVLPNSVPVLTNATLTGNGTTGSPLAVVGGQVPVAVNLPLTGTGVTGNPLGLTTPLPLQYGGTGVPASSNATLLTALGAASTAQVAAGYVALGGSVMTGLLTLSGNATANLNPVPLQQLNSAVAAVPSNSYGTTAPASPVAGTFWYNPTSQIGQMWSGTAWVTVVPAPVVTGVTLQGDTSGTGP